MTSVRERQQRAAARAKLAKQMAERRAVARRRRLRAIWAGGAAAVVLVAAGTVWLVTSVFQDEGTTPTPAPAAAECAWLPEDPNRQGYDQLTEVGTPPPGEPREGTAIVSIETERGPIVAELDTALAPCTAASITHLADQGFYDGTTCHRLVTENIFVLQCGDPTGTGAGGPTYRFAEENLPADAEGSPYPRGTLAMAKAQPPSTTGSQFFIVYRDTDLPPQYTVAGQVTLGMEIVDEIATGGASGPDGAPAPDGTPNEELSFQTLTVSPPSAAAPPTGPTGPPPSG